MTTKNLEKIPVEIFIKMVKNKVRLYKPKIVRRVEISTIWDRVIQQSGLQVIEPICDARFNGHSYGFRPNRSPENAVADCYGKIQRHL